MGGTDDHAVIFCGSGSTGAINKLVDVLEPAAPGRPRRSLRPGARSRRTSGRSSSSGRSSTTRNELPWRESIADVVTIHEDADGQIDLAQLEASWNVRGPAAEDRQLLGAANVTGILSDTRRSRPPPRHGALSFWDFAAAAPYVDIEMDPPDDPLAYKDAIFISPHKFIGGPGTPGVLVARRELFTQPRPDRTRRRHRRLRQPARARLPRRPRASRGGRHAGHRRVDPGGPRLPAQGGGRRRGDPRRARHSFIDRAIARWGAHPGHRGPRQPHGRAAVDRVLRRPPRPAATSTTTSSSRCSTTCSGSSRGAAARAPGRTATGCSASTSRRRTSSSARSLAAARASSRAGSGSTSTTSSARPCSTTSSPRSSSSRPTAGGCCRSTGFDAATGLWRHAGRLVGAAAVASTTWRYADGRPCVSRRIATARPSRAFADYLAEAGRLVASPPAPTSRRDRLDTARRRPGLRVPALVLAPRRGRGHRLCPVSRYRPTASG